jgi:hypothetical protein
MASDNFTRADENPLASPWVTMTGLGTALQVISNRCRSQNTGSSAASASLYSSSSSLTSKLTLSAVGNPGIGNSDAGPIVCGNASAGTGYLLDNDFDSGWNIFKLPGYSSVVSTASANWAIGVVAEIRREGNDLVGYKDGVEFIRGTDTDYMTGVPGAFIYQGPTAYSLWDDGGGAAATIYNRTIFGSPIFNSRVVRG